MPDQQQRSGGPAGGLLRGAGFLIGLGTELHAHNKARKMNAQAMQSQEMTEEKSPPVPCPKIALTPPTYEEATEPRPSIDATVHQSKTSTTCDKKRISVANDDSTTIRPLPLPVIIPQRRPNDKTRGFLRAYAPDLGTYKGIDEATFLNFLEKFHKSSQASGWFTVLNVAAMGAAFAPGVIAFAVTTSVQIGSTAAAEAQRRYRINSYLDNANENLFHPKNLHCMVMAFKPDASDTAVLNVGMDSKQIVPLPLSSRVTALSDIQRNRNNALTTTSSATNISRSSKFRKYDGMTEGELALPQAARLVMPNAPTPGGSGRSPSPQPTEKNTSSSSIDELPPRPHKPEGAWKSTVAFMSDYKDRRAQAKYAAAHSDSKLTVVGAADSARFASKFSDPNANPFEFMARGKSDYGDRDRRRRDQDRDEGRDDRSYRRDERRVDRRDRSRNDRRDRSRVDEYDDSRENRRDESRRRSPRGDDGEKKGLLGGVKSMIQQDVLYLLIAEIPQEVAYQVHPLDGLDDSLVHDDLRKPYEGFEKM